MKKNLKRLKDDIRKYGWTAALLPLYYLVVHTFSTAFCPIVALTGFPCPGCGMVRAALAIVSGQPDRAFRLNPSIFLWIFLGVWIIFHRYVRGGRIPALKKLLITIIVLMVLIYIWRMAVYYPGSPPMSYTGGSIFSRIISGYDDALRRLHLR